MVKEKQEMLFSENILNELDKNFKNNSNSHYVSENSLLNLREKDCSSVPTDLTRTGVFTAKSRNFITDSYHSKLFILDKYSAIRISGRELGTQHRKFLMSLFAIKPISYLEENDNYNPNDPNSLEKPYITKFKLITSWREILTAMGQKMHRTNIDRLFGYIEDMRKVDLQVFDSKDVELLEDLKNGIFPAGNFSTVIEDISWHKIEKKPTYDERIIIKFGSYTNKAIEFKKLATLDIKTLNSLKRDMSISIWPFLSSHKKGTRTFITEETIASLVDIDLAKANKEVRKDFRRKCKQSFEDMIQAGGLTHYGIRETKKGAKKSIQYYYTINQRKSLDLQPEFPDFPKGVEYKTGQTEFSGQCPEPDSA